MLICVTEQTSCKSKPDAAPPSPEHPLKHAWPQLKHNDEYLPCDCLVYSREQYNDHKREDT